MAGICGMVSSERCVDDLYWGTSYLQHRAQNYCGLALYNGENLKDYPHEGLLRQQFPKEVRTELKGNYGIGSVSVEKEPITELSQAGGMIMAFDGNIINHIELRDNLLKKGVSFSGYRNPKEVVDSDLISKLISSEARFEKGIERVFDEVKGDFAIVALTEDGVYAARGWGRKPLILGKKNGSYVVSSESNSFVNTKFEIARDVKPGEVVFIDNSGIHSIADFKLDDSLIRYGTFEWIYTAHPASVIDGKNVAEARMAIGGALARRFPVFADFISPVPNSGRWHAIGFSHESKIPYQEAFIRYDYSDRSYTPSDQESRNEEARTKLIPVREIIKGKRWVIVDDSIVRGTQLLNRSRVLRENGAEEVHVRIACPPLKCACKYGKSTRSDEECIARRMPIEEIRKKLELDSLGYAYVEDLELAIGKPAKQLCLECWGV